MREGGEERTEGEEGERGQREKSRERKNNECDVRVGEKRGDGLTIKKN